MLIAMMGAAQKPSARAISSDEECVREQCIDKNLGGDGISSRARASTPLASFGPNDHRSAIARVAAPVLQRRRGVRVVLQPDNVGRIHLVDIKEIHSRLDIVFRQSVRDDLHVARGRNSLGRISLAGIGATTRIGQHALAICLNDSHTGQVPLQE